MATNRSMRKIRKIRKMRKAINKWDKHVMREVQLHGHRLPCPEWVSEWVHDPFTADPTRDTRTRLLLKYTTWAASRRAYHFRPEVSDHYVPSVPVRGVYLDLRVLGAAPAPILVLCIRDVPYMTIINGDGIFISDMGGYGIGAILASSYGGFVSLSSVQAVTARQVACEWVRGRRYNQLDPEVTLEVLSHLLWLGDRARNGESLGPVHLAGRLRVTQIASNYNPKSGGSSARRAAHYRRPHWGYRWFGRMKDGSQYRKLVKIRGSFVNAGQIGGDIPPLILRTI